MASGDPGRLEQRVQSLLTELFVPSSALLKPGSLAPAIKEAFDQAGALYRAGSHLAALEAFVYVAKRADAARDGAGVAATINAVACAAMIPRDDIVLNLTKPLDAGEKLFGGPLWNRALASFRTGNGEAASRMLARWLTAAPSTERAKGHLVAAALAHKTGDVGSAEAHLSRARELDSTLVDRHFGTAPSEQPATAARSPAEFPQEIREKLLLLIRPTKPERRPELATVLSPEDVEIFTGAVEALADGQVEPAQTALATLAQKYRHPHLELALASALIFASRVEEARRLLLEVENSGARLTGNAYWNLARAEVLVGTVGGALRALNACSETEYRTKGALWQAIQLLTGDPLPVPKPPAPRSPAPVPPKAESTPTAPRSVDELRQNHLKRLIRIRKQPPAYRPDLGKLIQRDAETILQILKAASATDPGSALEMLGPWMRRHRELYTLRAHAASYAAAAGLLDEAHRILEEARLLRGLDRISRGNLAAIHLARADLPRAAKTLEGGLKSNLAESPDFWLALAILRAAAGQEGAAEAAARAVKLTNPSQLPELIECLRECSIQPAETIVEVSPLSSAGDALRLLQDNQPAAAAARLASVLGGSFDEVPEIGRFVLKPILQRSPPRRCNAELAAAFRGAVALWDSEDFRAAGRRFEQLWGDNRADRLAQNAIAAWLLAGDPRRARFMAQRALRGRQRHEHLAYNAALAHHAAGDHTAAIAALQRSPELAARRLAIVCMRDGLERNARFRPELARAIEQLRDQSASPSQQLAMAVAWVNLVQEPPRADLALAHLSQLVRAAALETRLPPAEVNSMQQVRTAWADLRGGAGHDVVTYLQAIVEAREIEGNTGLEAWRIERNVGVEFAALMCLAVEYQTRGDLWQAIRSLDRAEDLLDRSDQVGPGFLTRDWHELAKVSLELGLPWAALRRANAGLQIDHESRELGELRILAEAAAGPPERGASVGRELAGLARAIARPDLTLDTLQATLGAALAGCTELAKHTRFTHERFRKALAALREHDAGMDREELVDAVLSAGRAELPADALGVLESVLGRLTNAISQETERLIDVEIHEEQIWPKTFAGQACGLIAISWRGTQPTSARVRDRQRNEVVWAGELKPNDQVLCRWTFEREDEFVPEEQVDWILHVQMEKQPEVEVPVSAIVGSSEPSWPDYPPGSLQPSEVHGGKLYGRADILRQIVSSFGPTRPRANYLIESVRQMGKTSLLFFLRHEAPKHTFPVYVNLESLEGLEPGLTVWDHVVEQVLREAGRPVPAEHKGRRHADLVQLARNICVDLGKAYVVLLLDELHVLLRDKVLARHVLTELRADLNQPDHKIAVVFADRYTMRESERKVESEIWLQLSEVRLGPLDLNSTREAVQLPCEGRDARFPEATVLRIQHWTSGYPFHVQRLVQAVIERNFPAPWLVALPDDVDAVVGQIVEQDKLFREGLCRPERIDAELQAAISAHLEFRDLEGLLPILSKEPEWAQCLEEFAPRYDDLLATFGDPAVIVARLVDVGIYRRSDEPDRQMDFFSPLLESWIRTKRQRREPLYQGATETSWGLSPQEHAATMTKDDWLLLDGRVADACEKADGSGHYPLKPIAYRESWEMLVREVDSKDSFRSFALAANDCFVESRQKRPEIFKYPWLWLASERVRLVRNRFHHSGAMTGAAEPAWAQVCQRVLGGAAGDREPQSPGEWRGVQLLLLRTLELGLRNAIAIAARRRSAGSGGS